MMINKNTQVCISIAENPGNFGTTIHNILYQKYGLDFIYKSCKTSNIIDSIKGVRALGIRGCSISSPFKKTCLTDCHIENIDESSKITRVANSIVNRAGILTAFNTDLWALQDCLKAMSKNNIIQNALIIGSGATAFSAYWALKSFNKNIPITVSCRDITNYCFQKEMSLWFLPWELIAKKEFDLLINTTTIGSFNNEQKSFKQPVWENKGVVFDVVNEDTNLCQQASKEKIPCWNGKMMAIRQALYQFELYTGMLLADHKQEEQFLLSYL